MLKKSIPNLSLGCLIDCIQNLRNLSDWLQEGQTPGFVVVVLVDHFRHHFAMEAN